MVLFPQPLAPTRAVVFPAGIDMLKERRTGAPGREGYAKTTFETSMFPLQSLVDGISPESSNGSSFDCLSITPNSSDAAPAAAAMTVVWIATPEIEVAAIRAAKTTLELVLG